MIRLAALACTALALSVTAATAAQKLVFNGQTVGGLHAHKTGMLVLPKGTAPSPAVVILSGCNGVKHTTRIWARRLASWGYAALIVDSFRPRGLRNICHRGGELPASERADDAFAAAAYLRTRPDIDGSHIGLLGYSHGGWTALAAASEPLVAKNGGRAFAAIVAYYPICLRDNAALASDVLVLIGGADDWSSPKHCRKFAEQYAHATMHRPILTIYRGATHSFDVDRPARVYLGHRLAYDGKAAARSFALTRQFLGSHLRP